jgi:hypothetical protein
VGAKEIFQLAREFGPNNQGKNTMYKSFKCGICGWLDNVPRDIAPRCCENQQMVPAQD